MDDACKTEGSLNPAHAWVKMGTTFHAWANALSDDYQCRDCSKKVMVLQTKENNG